MITDNQTNKLFLADCLPRKQPNFFKRFEKVLKNCDIGFQFLPNTKDIWAVDYMPLQITTSKFIQFTYNPDYLQPKKYQKTISNVNSICNEIKLKRTQSDIILDGGNVIKTSDKVIMCDKVFFENPTYSRKQLIEKLEKLFEVDKLYFVPQQPKDYTGHADGMVRFFDKNTVIINDLSKVDKSFERAFYISLDNAGLDYITIPYNPYGNKTSGQANGCYINFLQMENIVIVPTFGIKEDELAVKKFEELFTGQTIATIDCNELANEGGVLNCITWNIKANK